jgi:hypothetical protein
MYHGRPTNRGIPEQALRNYSRSDVGLHTSADLATAEEFAEYIPNQPASLRNGFLYSGTYVGQPMPDFISPDFYKWTARSWKNLLDHYDNTDWNVEDINLS